MPIPTTDPTPLCRRSEATPRIQVRAWRRLEGLEAQRRRIRLLERERDQQVLVLRINNLLASQLEPELLFQALSAALLQEIPHAFMGLALLEPGGLYARVVLLHGTQGQEPPQGSLRGRFNGMVSSDAVATGTVDLLGLDRIAQLDPVIRRPLQDAGIRCMCCVPLASRGVTLGCLSFGRTEAGPFLPEEARFLGQIGVQLAIALDNALAYRYIQTVKEKLNQENLFLQEEAGRDFATREIVGNSSALMGVLQQIRTVAPSEATVLLLGETGTGKELLARAIHDRSRRSERPFVRLNCSAIPSGLMESELFGHERGAFTGAIQRKPGRFELAHLGTLFLDEVGDLPLELQPKLLRAIQEREFERLGSNITQKVDVRIIAATHRSLATMVEAGQFRQDLFYRLNVFPIQVPALRDRPEDIPGLVAYFVQKFARQLDRRIERIPADVMDRLISWSWPGNIRELQNIIERSVILSQGPDLRVPVADLQRPAGTEAAQAGRTLEELERLEIMKALRECRGVIGGPAGAAVRLGLKRTTLNSRMKKLGITRGQD